MKTRNLSFLFTIAVYYFTPIHPEGISKVQDSAIVKIDKYLVALEKQGFSGSVLVSINNQITLSKGYGYADDENKIPCTPQTIYTTGSITKPFTAAAILKLETYGKLNTGDSITKYFTGVPADKQTITLHHLLTHSAGFPGAIGDDYEPTTREQFLDIAFQTRLLFKPGTQYEYSNVGYSLLAAIVEIVSGQSYEQFLNKHLFLPAGMEQTGYILPAWDTTLMSVGYRFGKRWGKSIEKPWATDGPYWHLKGNGGILSSVEDMYRWHLALQSNKILNDEAKEKMYHRWIEEGEEAGTWYGYGWSIVPTPRNTTLVTHNGGNGIFFADFLRYIDEDVVVLYMTNRAMRQTNNVANLVARCIFIPDFQPRIPDLSPEMVTTFPDTPSGNTAGKFLDLLKKSDETERKNFIRNYYSQGFREMAGEEKHLNVMQRMVDDLGHAQLRQIAVSQGRFEIMLYNQEKNTALTLTLEFDSNDPGKISGIMVGME